MWIRLEKDEVALCINPSKKHQNSNQKFSKSIKNCQNHVNNRHKCCKYGRCCINYKMLQINYDNLFAIIKMNIIIQ